MDPRTEPAFGIGLPQVFPDGRVDVEAIRRSAREAERAGVHSLWVQSQTVTSRAASTLDPIGLLAAAAAHTTHLRLGTSVLVVTEHNPVQLANQLASLDVLSAGRLEVGLGSGSPQGATAAALGADRPVRCLLDTIATLDLLWSGEPSSFEGELWSFDDVRVLPTPVQRPRPPIWLGGSHPNALRRAVRRGDGWMGAGAMSTGGFRSSVAALHRELEAQGRGGDGFRIAKRAYLALDPDTNRAQRRVEEHFAAYSRNPSAAIAATTVGGAQRIVDEIGQIVEAGAGLVVLNPVYDHVDQQLGLYDLLRSHFPRSLASSRPD